MSTPFSSAPVTTMLRAPATRRRFSLSFASVAGADGRSAMSVRSTAVMAHAVALMLTGLMGATFAVGASAAQETAAAVHPAAGASAAATLQTAVEGTINAIQSNPTARGGDPAATATVVQSHFLPYTDFRRTARLATGDAWNTASPAQQEQIFQAFQTLLTRVYAAQLTQIQGQKVSFQFDAPTPVPKSTDVVIGSKVHTPSDDLSTRYRLEKTKEGYRIYDIDLMGIWMVQVYKQQFAAQLQAGGVDALIKYLKAHNAQGSGA
ncbi:MlaC/ttg2D family ABC transporter substrate-binding protein [Robbsia andropogonis]|uniref:MlaC/ttg2D family ABC transporter substrate-binding protein n=1 Tax=Robbsia andropogonis TaxID=28092 RepID=UPI000B25AF37|nr:ABC transporter substrate-binding protein [Robbsia andropogonis]